MFFFIITLTIFPIGYTESQQEFERPEKIYSKRQVIYDTETVGKLDIEAKYNNGQLVSSTKWFDTAIHELKTKFSVEKIHEDDSKN